MYSREAFPGLGVWSVEGLILVGPLFPLDGEEEKERKKKKIAMRKECFPRSRPVLLAVQQVAAVRYN
jgi:hypothetical protein